MPASTRPRRLGLWLFATCALVASGCALVSGLDQYDKGDAESGDGSDDRTVGDVVQPDAPGESGSDASPVDSSSDVVVADADGGGASDAGDAGDACTLGTTDNCSACGAKCDGTNATSTLCAITTCAYTCKTGFSNCNATAPDLNGCECATPSCCGASCATTHTNGIGQNYYDCVDAGTYNAQQGLKACTAYTADQLACQQADCIGTDGGPTGDLVICGNPDGGTCACWNYQGTDIGYVHQSGNATCFCPNNNDFKWN